jgi:hypothetical protein
MKITLQKLGIGGAVTRAGWELKFSKEFEELFALAGLKEETKSDQLEDLPASEQYKAKMDARREKEKKKKEEIESIKKADQALTAAKKAEEASTKPTELVVPDDKKFKKLGANSMASILRNGANINTFRASAFARVMQKEHGQKVVKLANSIHEKGYQEIKQDEVLLALFVQKLIDEDWVDEKGEKSNDFE